jgi:hypothetical protein
MALIENGAMTGTAVVEQIFFLGKGSRKLKNWSAQAEWTGTPTGTLKVQVSNKNPLGPNDNGSFPSFVAGDWVDLPDTTVAIAGSAGNQVYDAEDASYAWVKVIYTNTSGTGTLNVIAIKG